MRTKPIFFTPIFLALLVHMIMVSAAAAVIKIMPLGDSITNGNSSGTIPDTPAYHVSYRYALWDELDLAGYAIDFVGSLNTGSAVFGNTDLADHEGHPGWRDYELLDGRPLTDPDAGNLTIWLSDYQPEIVLLHIGTNGLDSSPDDVEAILDEIDAFSPNVWVVLARIINRNCITDEPTSCSQSVTTMNFNTNVANMAQARILSEDKIIVVDMEYGAGIDYYLTTDNPPGDMANNLHPFETGYAKMADLWFTGLMNILPQADAGNPQTVKETGTVTLDGSNSSDPDGTIASYLWEEVTTTGVTINNDTTTPTATFTAPVVNTAGESLTFKLTVTDADGFECTDDISITVLNCAGDFSDDNDVDGLDLVQYVIGSRDLDLEVFAADFGKMNCQ